MLYGLHGAYHIILNYTNIKIVIVMTQIDQTFATTKTKPAAKKATKAVSKSTITESDIVDKVIATDKKAPEVVDNKSLPVEEDKPQPDATVYHTDADVVSNTHVAKQHPVKHNAIATKQPFKHNNKPVNNKANGVELPPINGEYPAHMVEIALIIKNNAEIRRFTSLGVLNYLLQKGEIKGKSRFVTFKWNKFSVKVDTLTKEYSYTEPFFLNCLAASFASFSASAQKTIDKFIHLEMGKTINDVCSNEEIAYIHDSLTNK